MSPYRTSCPPPERRLESDEWAFAAVVLAGALAAFALAHAEGGRMGAIETLSVLVIALLLGERTVALGRSLRTRRAAGSPGTSTRRPPTSTG